MSGVRRLAGGLGVAAALMLCACGFTPLYATQGLAPGLSAIDVHVSHGRLAYLLGEALDDELARDRDKPPVYRLDVTVSNRVYPRGLNLDETAAYYENDVLVDYRLVEVATGRVLRTASEPVEVSYAATVLPYADIAAQQDAQQRAADEAAVRIRTDLGIYFATLAKK